MGPDNGATAEMAKVVMDEIAKEAAKKDTSTTPQAEEAANPAPRLPGDPLPKEAADDENPENAASAEETTPPEASTDPSFTTENPAEKSTTEEQVSEELKTRRGEVATEMTDENLTALERAINRANRKIIDLNLPPGDRDPKYAGERRVRMIHVLQNLKPQDEVTKDESGQDAPGYDLSQGNPLLVKDGDNRVALTRLLTRSDKNTFEARGKIVDAEGEPILDADGKEQIRELKDLPVQDVMDAQMVAEQDTIVQTLKTGEEQELFLEHIQKLEEQRDGTYVQADSDELNRLQEIIDKAKKIQEESKEKETMQTRVEERVRTIFPELLGYEVGLEPGILIHYADKYKDFAQLLKANMQQEKAKLGDKFSNEDALFIQMKTIAEIQTRNSDNHVNSPQHGARMEQWKTNFRIEKGRMPSSEELAAESRRLTVEEANNKDLEVITSKERLMALQEKISRGEFAAIIAFLIAMVGKEFIEPLLPKAQ